MQYKQRAAFCKFYGVTPAEVRSMTLAEYNAFVEYMAEYVREANRGA